MAGNLCRNLQRAAVPICDLTGNDLIILSVYQSSKIDCFSGKVTVQQPLNEEIAKNDRLQRLTQRIGWFRGPRTAAMGLLC